MRGGGDPPGHPGDARPGPSALGPAHAPSGAAAGLNLPARVIASPSMRRAGRAATRGSGETMAESAVRFQERIARRQVDKFAERRSELADAAIETLSERGYARTSLREIAQNSAFSHGVLHYYFADKADLITFCVRRYKTQCVRRYDEIMARAAAPEELIRGYVAALAETLRTEAPMHRLWYDIRGQSMFENQFRADVEDIDKSLENMMWRIMTRYAALSHRRLVLSPAAVYAAFDGLFQHCLIRHLAGDTAAVGDLIADAGRLMPSLVTD